MYCGEKEGRRGCQQPGCFLPLPLYPPRFLAKGGGDAASEDVVFLAFVAFYCCCILEMGWKAKATSSSFLSFTAEPPSFLKSEKQEENDGRLLRCLPLRQCVTEEEEVAAMAGRRRSRRASKKQQRTTTSTTKALDESRPNDTCFQSVVVDTPLSSHLSLSSGVGRLSAIGAKRISATLLWTAKQPMG